jgi:penicillin-binding protein 1C
MLKICDILRRSPEKADKRKISILKKIVLCGIACVCGLLLLAAIDLFFLPGGNVVPAFEEVRAGHLRSESVLLDRHNEILQELRTNSRGRRLEWVRLQDISPALPAAILAAEDRRFYKHRGVDWASLASVAAGFFHSGSRGASTITMQLAARLNTELQPSGQHRTIYQKWEQMRAARVLERSWSKEQILEAYVNLVSYRGELQGLAAAAGGLFGKQVHGLTQAESIILAALLRSPNADPNQVAKRACKLADSMNLQLSHSEISARAGEALNRPYFIQPQAALAPHVAQRVFAEAQARGGQAPDRIVCTIDRSLQQFAADALYRHVMSVRAQNVHDGAVLVLDNTSGEVLAYVGNTGESGSARYVDGVQAFRQAGSTLKPLIYGAAIDQHILTASSLIDDSPLDIPVAGGVYRPNNYDRLFHGPVTVRTALASSLNVPAVKTLNLVGVESAIKVLEAAGFQKLESPEFYGPSLALGAADIRLHELTNAYRCMANKGAWSPIHFTFGEPQGKPRQALSPQAAFIVMDILSDRESRSRTFSLESPLSTRFWTAVKTGTSKDMRDNWCIGSSSLYTVGVWAGNFSGEPMRNVSGISGAAPVWVDVMNWLHRDRTSRAPEAPPGVLAAQTPGQGRKEWFIQGTENAVLTGMSSQGFRISYPAHGTIFALDPDIPSEEQKLFFEAQPKDGHLHWVLDGQRIGSAGALLLWTPLRGKHALSLTDASDRVIDAVSFEVRGQF